MATEISQPNEMDQFIPLSVCLSICLSVYMSVSVWYTPACQTAQAGVTTAGSAEAQMPQLQQLLASWLQTGSEPWTGRVPAVKATQGFQSGNQVTCSCYRADKQEPEGDPAQFWWSVTGAGPQLLL